jgi:hypothetical protein
MNSSNLYDFRGAFAATLAAAIVGTSGLALDHAHPDTTPRGVIEVGELTPIDVLPQVVQLPEVTVTATRIALASDTGRA